MTNKEKLKKFKRLKKEILEIAEGNCDIRWFIRLKDSLFLVEEDLKAGLV